MFTELRIENIQVKKEVDEPMNIKEELPEINDSYENEYSGEVKEEPHEEIPLLVLYDLVGLGQEETVEYDEADDSGVQKSPETLQKPHKRKIKESYDLIDLEESNNLQEPRDERKSKRARKKKHQFEPAESLIAHRRRKKRPDQGTKKRKREHDDSVQFYFQETLRSKGIHSIVDEMPLQDRIKEKLIPFADPEVSYAHESQGIRKCNSTFGKKGKKHSASLSHKSTQETEVMKDGGPKGRKKAGKRKGNCKRAQKTEQKKDDCKSKQKTEKKKNSYKKTKKTEKKKNDSISVVGPTLNHRPFESPVVNEELTSLHSPEIKSKIATNLLLTEKSVRNMRPKPYHCEYCPSTFSQKYYLKLHTMHHTEERPYQCDICHKGFRMRWRVAQHRLIHSSVRPFPCMFCTRGCNRKDNLRTHILKVHGKVASDVYTYGTKSEKPFDLCGMKSEKPMDLFGIKNEKPMGSLVNVNSNSNNRKSSISGRTIKNPNIFIKEFE